MKDLCILWVSNQFLKDQSKDLIPPIGGFKYMTMPAIPMVHDTFLLLSITWGKTGLFFFLAPQSEARKHTVLFDGILCLIAVPVFID